MSTVPSPMHPPEALWRRVIAPPSTRVGRRAAWLVGAVMAVLAIVGGLVLADVPESGWAAQAALGLSSLAAVVGAAAAGVMAVVAIHRGERSIVTLAPLLFGSYCVLFLVGELLVPH